MERINEVTNNTSNKTEYGYIYGHKCKILERYNNNQSLIMFNNMTFIETDIFIETSQQLRISDEKLKEYITLYKSEQIISSFTFSTKQIIFLLKNLGYIVLIDILLKYYINDLTLKEIKSILKLSSNINEIILDYRKFNNKFLDKNFNIFSTISYKLVVTQKLEQWFIEKHIQKLDIKTLLLFQKHLSDKFKEQLKIMQKFEKV